MKTSILMMSLAVAAMTFTSCNKEENEIAVDNWNGEIRLSSGVTVQTRANNSDVPDTQIASEQSVQVVVGKQDGAASTYLGYSQVLTAQGNGTFADPVTAMYYPESGEGVSIYAYHPSTAGASFVTNPNQSADVDYYNSDLLYSAKTDYARQKATHSLSFNHKLSKLTSTLVAGAGVPSLEGATVAWTNVCNTADFEKTTGMVANPKNSTTITPHATYGAIIVPQTVALGTALMTVTLKSGGILTYKPTINEVFEGGKKYHYTITVNLTSLTVTSTIMPWEVVEKSGGSAEMQ